MSNPRSIVYLVGAGPGDPGLITVAGLSALRKADVVIFDRLVDRALLKEVRPDCEWFDVGKARGSAPVPQAEINRLILQKALAGRCVVRLKGGDPFVFGRGFEELNACRENDIPCVVIPGVTSAVAAPEVAGIPLTLRGVSRSFAVLTAETSPETDNAIDFAEIRGIDTLVILMGRSKLESIARSLIDSGWPADTPVACIEQATRPAQRIVSGTLSTIASEAEKVQLAPPMVTVIGPTAAQAHLSMNQTRVPGQFSHLLAECRGEGHPPLPLGRGFGMRANPLSPREAGPSDRQSSDLHHLQGKSVLITRPAGSSRNLIRRLEQIGATPISCPLIRIEIPRQNPPLDASIARLNEYKWLAFTSTHAVTAFQRRLVACGFDARRLSGCKLAALGGATARRLRSIGLTPDITARNAAELARNMIETSSARGRVLWPRGDCALSKLRDTLERAKIIVDDPVAYCTLATNPAPSTLEKIRAGPDAVLLYSPSAVAQLASLDVSLEADIIVCIGPTTAAAAMERGLRVAAVAAAPTDDAVLAALAMAFDARVASRSPSPLGG